MSLYVIVFILLMVCCLADYLLSDYVHAQKQIFHVAFILTYVLFTAKYYYGPDIFSYVPYYEEIPKLEYLSRYDSWFEPGYAFFCSLCKTCRLSFWWMTAIVSTIYFASIYCLLRKPDKHATFALLIIIVFDYSLIFATFRQCLAVALYVFMVMALSKRRLILGIALCLATALCHKSGIAVAIPTLLLMLIPENFKVGKNVYWLLLLILLSAVFVPMVNFSSFVETLPIDQTQVHSLAHHLQLGKDIQTVLAVYVIFLILTAFYNQYTLQYVKDRDETDTYWVILLSFCLIVVLYKYFWLLMRLRSYFVPFLATYIVRIAYDDNGIPKSKHQTFVIIRQAMVVGFLIYTLHLTNTKIRDDSKLKSRVYETCTIFELPGKSVSDVQYRQIERAKQYWQYEYLQNNTDLMIK